MYSIVSFAMLRFICFLLAPFVTTKVLYHAVLDPANTALDFRNSPFLTSHNAATGSLPTDDIYSVYYKNQDDSFASQLDCGARALDLRLQESNLDAKYLVFKHGIVRINLLYSTALAEIINWRIDNNNDPTDLIVLIHTGTEKAILQAKVELSAKNIPWLNSSDYTGKSLQQVLDQAGDLNIIAIDDSDIVNNYDNKYACSIPNPPVPTTDCVDDQATRDSLLSCFETVGVQQSSFSEAESQGLGLFFLNDLDIETFCIVKSLCQCYDEQQPAGGEFNIATCDSVFNCQVDRTPQENLFDFLADNIQDSLTSDSPWKMQSFWQATSLSLFVDTMMGSSILIDEAKSKLNENVAIEVKTLIQPQNFLLVDGVCNSGADIAVAMRGGTTIRVETTSSPTETPVCENDLLFKDIAGFSCESWWCYNCRDASYSVASIVDLEERCCLSCSSSHEGHELCADLRSTAVTAVLPKGVGVAVALTLLFLLNF